MRTLGFNTSLQSFYTKDSEEQTKNKQRTNKEQEEQGKCSEEAPFNLAKFIFLHNFISSQLVKTISTKPTKA
jgi:hypothetical protein